MNNASKILDETALATKNPRIAAAARRVKAMIENTMASATTCVDPTFRSKSASRTQRAERLLNFANSHGVSIHDVKLIENNSWSIPPRGYGGYCKDDILQAELLGGTTYQYQVWACLK